MCVGMHGCASVCVQRCAFVKTSIEYRLNLIKNDLLKSITSGLDNHLNLLGNLCVCV